MSDFPIKDVPIGKTQHCPNCETLAREVERWRLRAEQYNNGWTAMGVKAQALVDRQSTEIERLRHDLERQMTIANEHVNEVEALRQSQPDVLKKARDAINGLLDMVSAYNLDSEEAGRAFEALHEIGTALAALGQSK